MKVLLVTHLYPDKDDPVRGTFVREQAEALGHRCQVDVVVPGHADTTSSRSGGVAVDGLSLPKARDTGGRMAYLVWSLRYAWRLWWAPPSSFSSADIIHAHFGFPDGVAAVAAAARHAKPVVVTLHGSDVAKVLGRPDAFGWLVRKVLRRADRLVCVSESMRTEVFELLGVEGRRVVTVQNGYDDRLFKLGAAIRSEDFLFVGALRAVKNPVLLIHAFADAAPIVAGNLIVVGDGPCLDEMRSVAASLGIENRVGFRGRLSRTEVASLMKCCRALVLPSQREGMPMVVLEALATGTPVLASSVGGIPEVVSAESGILFEPDDVSGLTHAIVTAAVRSWDSLAVRERSGVRPWADAASDLMDLYEDVLLERGV